MERRVKEAAKCLEKRGRKVGVSVEQRRPVIEGRGMLSDCCNEERSYAIDLQTRATITRRVAKVCIGSAPAPPEVTWP